MEPGDPASTIELIGRAKLGDQAAVDRLFARHFPPLRRWARGRLPHWARDLADTDDLVQEALLRTFRRIGEIDVGGAGSLQAYLRQAVLNRVRDELRHSSRRPKIVAVDGGEQDSGLSPLEQAIGRDTVEQYEQALGRLKPEEREAIVARVEMGYTYEELAESLGKPTWDAARKAAKRALVRLAQEMARGRG
jgi:RNA polymerase sigma-70 factor (ECF subfamily)